MPRNVSVEKTFDAFATQTFAASFTPDISNVATVRVLMTGNITALNAPTGRNWGRMTLIFEQDTTGGRTVTWNTGAYSLAALGYDWQPMDIGNGVSSVTLQYNATTSMWDMLSSFGGDLILGGTSAGIKWLGSSASLKLNASGFLQASNYQAVTAMYAPTVHGSTSSGGSLTLSSTSNATKGKVFFGTSSLSAFDQVNNRLGIGNVSPTVPLDVTGTGVFSGTVTGADPTASTHLTTKNYVDGSGDGSFPTQPPSGAWFNPRPYSIVSTATPTVSSMILVPFRADKTGTINGLAYELTTTAVAVSGTDVMRFGLYGSSSSTGRPTGAALFDSGTQDNEVAAAVKTVSVSWTGITRGTLYWLAMVRQTSGTVTTAAVLRHGQMNDPIPYFFDTAATPTIGTTNFNGYMFTQASVTGALPTIGTITSGTAVVPMLLLKYA